MALSSVKIRGPSSKRDAASHCDDAVDARRLDRSADQSPGLARAGYPQRTPQDPTVPRNTKLPIMEAYR